MKLSWRLLTFIILILAFAAYGAVWVAGEPAPLWLKIFFTVTIGLGLVLIIIQNQYTRELRDK